MTNTTKVIVGVVVVVAIVLVVYALGHRGSAPVAEELSPTPTPTPTATATASVAAYSGSYTSAADMFTVNFPAAPVVRKTTFTLPSVGEVPITDYRVELGTDASAKYYLVTVYHYPKTYKFASDYLASALRLFVSAINAKYPGAKLTSQTPTQLLGNPAISGVITVTINGQKTVGYLLIATKNQNTYGMGTYNVDQNGYETFLHSFSFTK